MPTITTLQNALFGPNSREAEVARRTRRIHDIAQSPDAPMLGPVFKRLAADIMTDIAALLCASQSEQSSISLVGTLCSIERLAKRRVSQTRLERAWKSRSYERRITKYRAALEKHLAPYKERSPGVQAVFEQDGSVIRLPEWKPALGNGAEGFDNTINGHKSQDPRPRISDRSVTQVGKDIVRRPVEVQPSDDGERRSPNPLAESATCSRLEGDDPTSLYQTISRSVNHEPLNHSCPEYTQANEFSPPPQPTQSQSEAASPTTAASSDLPPASHPPSLGSPVFLLFGQLTVNFTLHIENHNSLNTTAATVVHSNNDSSTRRST